MPNIIIEVFVLLLIACFVSMVLELNKFGANLEKGINKPSVVYISSALISAICGLVTALTGVLFNDKIILWIILDIIGTFLGTKSLKIVLKIICVNVSFLKDSKILDDAMKDIDEISKSDIEDVPIKKTRKPRKKTNDEP